MVNTHVKAPSYSRIDLGVEGTNIIHKHCIYCVMKLHTYENMKTWTILSSNSGRYHQLIDTHGPTALLNIYTHSVVCVEIR